MNFLFKSISSFQFPYTLEQEFIHSTPFWQVQNGTRKSDSLPVTIYTHTKQQPVDHNVEALVANAVHKSKVLKLPGLVRVIDVIDSDQTVVYIVTERVRPLPLDELSRFSQDAINLGIYQLVNALQVLHEQAKVVLGTLAPGSIYINERGEWCLFGLELCSSKNDLFHLKQYSSTYASTVRRSDLEVDLNDSLQIDSILLSCLIKKLLHHVPGPWNPLVQGLSQGKLTIAQFQTKSKATPQFQSPLISIFQDLQELHIKDPQGKMVIMSDLQRIVMDNRGILNNCTPGLVDGLIIPELAQCITTLISSQQPSITGFTNVVPFLATILEFSCSASPAMLSESTFEKYIKPLIFENFKITDRQLRFLLLVYFPGYINKLTNSEISEKIFQYFLQGLADTDVTLRLQTLKKIPHIATKISERQLNNDLLRYLAKTQIDSDVQVRVWTILIISEISSKLSSSASRAGILSTAFTKSLKDPDVKPRLAALYGLEKALDLFDAKTIATKILTVIAPSLLDKNITVRTRARVLFDLYLSKLEEEAKTITAAQDDSDDVDFDTVIRDNGEDVLVKEFLDNLKISSPGPVVVPKDEMNDSATAIATENDAWDTGDDVNDNWGSATDDHDGWDDGESSFDKKATDSSTGDKNVKIKKSGNDDLNNDNEKDLGWKGSKPKTGNVRIQKSWNDELNEDDWNSSWHNPKPTKTLAKPSYGTKRTILAKRNTPIFSKSTTNYKDKPKHSTNDVEEEDADGWGEAW